MAHRFKAGDGVELVWDELGEPQKEGHPTLVLVHGYTGSALDFAEVAPELAQHRRVVTIDQRGHGRSTKNGTLEGYSIEQLSTDLTAFLDAHGDGPVDLLGHSMGGRVVLGTALARPDLVNSLILMDTSAWSFVPDNEKIRAGLATFMDRLDPSRGVPDPKTFDLGGPEADLILAVAPEHLRERDRNFLGMDPYAIKALGMAILGSEGSVSYRERLGEIKVPATFLVGEHDHPMVDQAAEHVTSLSDGHLALIPGAYHSPQLTHRTEWLAAIEGHLAGA
ncbi:MAG TPA: alpha/beta hydrolase [Acidimicrobiales bacterium]|jgi:pimeloyl-ACP methyl ester carboxylesterase|nr:alpha/beta hydrolase [Acidimicrobiales bacterium]